MAWVDASLAETRRPIPSMVLVERGVHTVRDWVAPRRTAVNRDTEILFEVRDDALVVANGGRPFSRKGVISICASHLSDKWSDDADEDANDDFDCADEDLVQNILTREVGTYSNDRNRITSDYRGEDETSRDYGGRFVWELLQNADDAMGPARSSVELIGSKGLGFKAVLEVTEEPEVHSGSFHFRFSAADTQALLQKKNLHYDPPPLTFRIPHFTSPSDAVQGLLDAGYATVICLPFRNDEAKELVVKQLNRLDPLFLLLTPRLTRVRIRTPNGETVHEITGGDTGLSDGDVRLSRSRPTGIESSVPWRRWTWKGTQEAKHLTVAICLPLTEQHGSEPVPCLQCPPLFAFFPTQEDIGVRALVHATFDLEHNRKHVRRGDHDDEILGALEELVERVLADVPARTALQAFGEIEPDETQLIGRLQHIVRDTVAKSELVPTVGGRFVKANEVCFWRHRLGFVLRDDVEEVADACLLAPGYRDLISILRSFGAEDLSSSDYVHLLKYCRNASLVECLRSWITLMHVLTKHEWTGGTSQVPCWWIETETTRSLADPTPLLLQRPKGGWPDWLPVDALHPGMARAVRWMEGRPGRSLSTAISQKLLRNGQAYLRYALAPHVSQWTEDEWEEMGWEALRQVRKWWPGQKFHEVLPWVEEYRHRATLRTSMVDQVCLPTDKGWLPAIDCYAGEAWGGLSAFDGFFADVTDRGIVLPFGQWSTSTRDGLTEEDWKPLLRWLGVSWEPKVCAVRGSFPTDERSMSQGLLKYFNHLDLRPWWDYRSRWRFNLWIEHFPECMENSTGQSRSAVDAVIRLRKAMEKKAIEDQRGYYFYYRLKSCESYAQYQLRHAKWLPCKPALLHDSSRVIPSQAFMSGKGLGGLLPEVSRAGIDHEYWFGTVVPVLRRLGVHDGLPEDAVKWHSWMSRLPGIECEPEDKRRAADALYLGYLGLDDPGPFPSQLEVPCLVLDHNDHEFMIFSSADEVYFVDEPHLEEVKRDVMRQGYKLFILMLDSGENAPSMLGVNWLSDVLDPRTQCGHEDTMASAAMRRRYRSRRLGLGLAAGLEGELPADLDVRAVKGLRLILVGDNGVVAEADVLSWRADGESPLLVNVDRNRWRALGHGLAVRVAEKESKATLFEALLREGRHGEYLDRLRYEGITETDLERLEKELTDGIGGGEEQEVPDPPVPDSQEADDRDGRIGEDRPVPRGRRVVRPPHEDSPVAPSEREASGVGSDPRGGPSASKSGGYRSGEGTAGKGRPDSAAGRDAEDWLWKRLETGRESTTGGYYRVERRERDLQNRESDFVIYVGGPLCQRRRGESAVHIEVKHLAGVPGKVHWSSGQCSKARDILGNDAVAEYIMAVLISDESDGERPYRVYWLWHPVDQLLRAKREVQWEGRSTYEPVMDDSWEVAAQKPDRVPVKRHMFRIEVDDRILSSLDKDDHALGKLWRRVEDRYG